jgi:DNA-binding beta-propeller fold protein YncE
MCRAASQTTKKYIRVNLVRKALTTGLALMAIFLASASTLQAQVLGGFVYVTTEMFNNISAYKIDAMTGTLSFIGNVSAGAQPRGIAVDRSGRFVAVANQASNNVSA